MQALATDGRDPRTTGKGISTLHVLTLRRFAKGFTVIELMIGLGVLAIITALAVPSYRTVIEKRQVTSGAEQISAFLGHAQFESVKRYQFVAVNFQEDDGLWCFGLRANNTAAVNCDCTVTDVGAANACVLDGALRVLNSTSLSFPEVLQDASVGGDGTVVFDPVRGLMQDAETVSVELESTESHYALDVEVSVTGRVKICSNEAANKDVPGFRQCS